MSLMLEVLVVGGSYPQNAAAIKPPSLASATEIKPSRRVGKGASRAQASHRARRSAVPTITGMELVMVGTALCRA
jgi:hypothetical protein